MVAITAHAVGEQDLIALHCGSLGHIWEESTRSYVSLSWTLKFFSNVTTGPVPSSAYTIASSLPLDPEYFDLPSGDFLTLHLDQNSSSQYHLM